MIQAANFVESKKLSNLSPTKESFIDCSGTSMPMLLA